jgi:hypothetical protein
MSYKKLPVLITLNITGQTKKKGPYYWFIPVTGSIKKGNVWLGSKFSGFSKP